MKSFIALLCLIGATAFGQTATAPASAQDYFNNGSATFIREDPTKALAIVNEGLSFHPDNEPLLKLKALLEQQQQQNQQNQNQNQDQKKEDQDQQDQNQPQNEQDQDQQKPEDEQKPDEDDLKQDQNQGQPPPQEEKESGEEQAAKDMSEEEANMVLDSLRQLEQAQREQMTQHMIRQQMQNPPPVEKDW